MSTRWLIVSVLTLLCPATTYGQAYVFQGGDYSYLHTPWFRIDECSGLGDCDFNLNGVLGIHIGGEEALTFTTTDLELTGNEDLVDHPLLEYAPITGDRVAELLRDQKLTLVSDEEGTKSYEWDRGNFMLKINANTLRLHGGYDSRPVDGDGVFFDATGVRTWLGDSNLDLNFDSGDLVHVLGAGLYEDKFLNNATWNTGDWNGDRDFDSGDLVAAFQDGGYERGQRKVVSPVPEPTSCVLLIAGLIGVAMARRFDVAGGR